MGKINEYLIWVVDNFKDTEEAHKVLSTYVLKNMEWDEPFTEQLEKFKESPEAYDVLMDYVMRNSKQLGPKYSMQTYLNYEESLHGEDWGKIKPVKYGE